MRIYDSNLTGTSAAESGRAADIQRAERGSGSRTGTAASGSGDRVELSSALGSLSQAIASFDSNRSARISALAAQYQNGSYRADSMETSRGMVSEAVAAGMK